MSSNAQVSKCYNRYYYYYYLVNFNNGVRLCPLTYQGSEKHSSNGSLWYIYGCVLEQTSTSFCLVIKSYVSHYQPRSYRHSCFCILPRAHGSCPCSCLRRFHGHHHNVIWVFSRRPVLVMSVFSRYEGACSCSKGLVLVFLKNRLHFLNIKSYEYFFYYSNYIS